MRRLGLALYGAALAIAFGLFLIGIAHAQANVGVGVICDTAEQATRYVELLRSDSEYEAAIDRVNAEVGAEHACGHATVAFVPIEEVAHVSNGVAPYRIVRVQVIGAGVEGGIIQVPPKVYFAIARMPGYDI